MTGCVCCGSGEESGKVPNSRVKRSLGALGGFVSASRGSSSSRIWSCLFRCLEPWETAVIGINLPSSPPGAARPAVDKSISLHRSRIPSEKERPLLDAAVPGKGRADLGVALDLCSAKTTPGVNPFQDFCPPFQRICLCFHEPRVLLTHLEADTWFVFSAGGGGKQAGPGALLAG